MKTIKHLLLVTCLATGFPILAAEPAPPFPANEAPSAPATIIQTNNEAAANSATAPATTDAVAEVGTNAVAGTNAITGTIVVAGTNASEPTVVVENGTNGILMNFRNAPLNLVLDYLSDAAGFIINKETEVRGTVEVRSKEPVTKDEAVELLNSVLKSHGCAVIRNGRILTIVSQDGVNHKDTPIISGNNPDEVERGDEVVTQIIPVKYASVTQLVPNLELLLPTTATLSANESANTLILVATKTDVKRVLKIVTALDTSIASVSSIRVIPLRFADSKDTATLITALFAPQATGPGGNAGGGGGRGALFNMIAGGGFGGGGFGGRGGAAAAGGRGGGGGGGAAAAKVVAVADDRSNSLVISAPADLLTTIETMVKEIDQEVTDVTELRVFRLKNADPSETADQLATLFPDPTASTTGGQNNVPFFMRGPFGGGGRGAAAAGASSDRAKKMGRVLAVPDPRTSSIIITASKTLMPQISDMIAELDSDKGRKEIVGFFDLQNADPQDVFNNLQDLFNRSTVRAQNNNQNPLMGANSPLATRVKNSTSATANSTTMGSGFGGGGSRSLGGGF